MIRNEGRRLPMEGGLYTLYLTTPRFHFPHLTLAKYQIQPGRFISTSP